MIEVIGLVCMGIVWLILIALVLYLVIALLIHVWKRDDLTTTKKLLWTIIVVVSWIIGVALYLIINENVKAGDVYPGLAGLLSGEMPELPGQEE